MSFAIVTDTGVNLPGSLLEKHQITAIPFAFYLNSEEIQSSEFVTPAAKLMPNSWQA